jgi:hypothetical protein
VNKVNIKKIIEDFDGTSESIIVPNSKKLTNGYEVNISKYSGLVSVINRRSSKQIADTWSNKIFGNKFSKDKYTAKIPAVVARHIYVLETIIDKINLKNKKFVTLELGKVSFLNYLKRKK